jgi:hypothetical protein
LSACAFFVAGLFDHTPGWLYGQGGQEGDGGDVAWYEKPSCPRVFNVKITTYQELPRRAWDKQRETLFNNCLCRPLIDAVCAALSAEADRRLGRALGPMVPIWRHRHWQRQGKTGTFYLDHVPEEERAPVFRDRCGNAEALCVIG